MTMARPPSTYEGRTNTGNPIFFAASTASSTEATIAPGACGMSSSSSSLPKRLRSSARSIDSGVVPMMLTPAALSGKHVLERKRLEVEAVAGIVVGRDRLRIAVDHDGFVAILAQRVAGVAAAIIKFNSLPDAVGTGTEDDDFLLRRGRGLVFFFVGGVEIRCVAFELRGAGIDPLVNRF